MTEKSGNVEPTAVLQDDALIDALAHRSAPSGALSDPAARLLADLSAALDAADAPGGTAAGRVGGARRTAGPPGPRGWVAAHPGAVRRHVVAGLAAACAALALGAVAARTAERGATPSRVIPSDPSASMAPSAQVPSRAGIWVTQAAALLAPTSGQVTAADLRRAAVLLARAEKDVRAEERARGFSPDRARLDAVSRELAARWAQAGAAGHESPVTTPQPRHVSVTDHRAASSGGSGSAASQDSAGSPGQSADDNSDLTRPDRETGSGGEGDSNPEDSGTSEDDTAGSSSGASSPAVTSTSHRPGDDDEDGDSAGSAAHDSSRDAGADGEDVPSGTD